MGYNSEGWSGSHSSEEEAAPDWELEREFDFCKEACRLKDLVMDKRTSGRGYDGRRNYDGNSGHFAKRGTGFNRNSMIQGRGNTQNEGFVPETQFENVYSSDDCSNQPALKYPTLFPSGSLFDRFPYLLQALCVSGFTLFGICAYFILPETLHKHPISDLECSTSNDSKRESILEEKPKSIYKNWSLMASISVYCLWSLHDISYTEIFSLWAESPKETGGLNLSTTDVGDILAISGFSMLIFQLTLYPLAAKLFGAIMVTRVSAVLTVPLLVAYPYFYLLDGTSLWVVVNAASIAKNVLSAACLTGSFILINNSVAQSERGAANGLSLSLVSLFKSIGPVGGGSIFAWSQTRQHSSVLPGDQLVFFVLNMFAFLAAITTFPCCLPPSTNHLPNNDDIDDDQ